MIFENSSIVSMTENWSIPPQKKDKKIKKNNEKQTETMKWEKDLIKRG